MEMGQNQSFREYVAEWRAKANCIAPPLGQDEAVPIFIGTLRGIYYTQMMSQAEAEFSSLIKIGELIERGLRSGRIEDPGRKEAEARRAIIKRPAPTVGAVYPAPHQAPYPPRPFVQAPYTPRSQQESYPQPYPQNQGGFQRRPAGPRQYPSRQFTILPVPLTALYKRALAQDLIGPEVLGPNSRIPMNEPNAKCAFHMDAPGHSTDNCPRLRNRIQDLLDHKLLILNPIPPPNVNTNPLPNHAAGPSR